MKGKVTKELLERMKQARLEGKTYSAIESEFGVSRWTTLAYLKGIKKDAGVATELWKRAEIQALAYLEGRGFSDIINLNNICPQSYFDVLCRKDGELWLIDTTINESKDLAKKSMRVINNYRCAVLYVSHDLTEFNLVELKPVV